MRDSSLRSRMTTHSDAAKDLGGDHAFIIAVTVIIVACRKPLVKGDLESCERENGRKKAPDLKKGIDKPARDGIMKV